MANVSDVLKPVLSDYGVAHALIIDDAYDLSIDDYVTDEMWDDFCEGIGQHSASQDELASIGVNGDSPSRSKDTLSLLLVNQDKLNSVMGPSARLLVHYEPKMQALTKLETLLTHCDVNVTTQGPTAPLNNAAPCDIAFIDFFLDDNDHPEADEDIDITFLDRPSVKRSRELAVDVFKKTNAFIVLMSSFQSVQEVEDAFQQSADFLLKGFFKFTAKSDLDKDEFIAERLLRLPLDKQLRQTVSQFTETLESCFADVASQVSKTVRDLSVQDYAYLCNLVLRTESHPLGDYLTRMVASHLVAKLAEGDLEPRKQELDRIFLKRHFPLQENPTTAFATLYSSHICEKLPHDVEDGWVPHPMFGPTAEEDIPLAKLPFLQFGDLLTLDANSDVHLVLNAGCDLMFGPERTSRQPDDTVLLLPGALRKLHDPIDDTRTPSAFTWLIVIEGEDRRIEWDFRRVITMKHQDVETTYREMGYKRKSRLGAVDALALQQGLLSHIGRVATQSPPLIASWHGCSVYCKGSDGMPAQVGDGTMEGMLVGIHRRSSPNYVADQLTMPDTSRRRLSEVIRNWIVKEQHSLENEGEPDQPESEEGEEQVVAEAKMKEYNKTVKRRERRQKLLDQMQEMLIRWKLQFDLDDTKPFPGGRSSGAGVNSERIVLNDIVVCRELKMEEQWKYEQTVMLQIESK